MRISQIGWLVIGGAAWFASSPEPAAGSPNEQTSAIAVESADIVEVTPSEGVPLTMLHVRVVLSNPGVLAWRFDPRTTRIDLGRDGLTWPALANADVPTLPIVRVEPAASVTVDLFAPVPGGVTEVDRLELRARVASPDRRYHLTARYRRPALVPDATVEHGAPVGAAAAWWADPAFPWATFRHGPGPVTPRVPVSAVVVPRAR